jgi:hypothetical protein
MAPHTYQHHSPDPILGIRIGVNAVDIANAERLAPRGKVMQRAAQLALVQFKTQPRNAAPTIRVENIRTAQIEFGGKPAERRPLEAKDLKRMIRVDEAIERERNKVARERYAENRARREAAAAAKRAERAEKRAARKAAKEAAAAAQ